MNYSFNINRYSPAIVGSELKCLHDEIRRVQTETLRCDGETKEQRVKIILRIRPLSVLKAVSSGVSGASPAAVGGVWFSLLGSAVWAAALLHNTRREEQPKFSNTTLRAGNRKIYTA